uniref:Uncharacterized protein n=1 Tax=Solanum lycopersicum TaxID=4081 RepID=A0A3Q7J679_SOLLC
MGVSGFGGNGVSLTGGDGDSMTGGGGDSATGDGDVSVTGGGGDVDRSDLGEDVDGLVVGIHRQRMHTCYGKVEHIPHVQADITLINKGSMRSDFKMKIIDFQTEIDRSYSMIIFGSRKHNDLLFTWAYLVENVPENILYYKRC